MTIIGYAYGYGIGDFGRALALALNRHSADTQQTLDRYSTDT